MKKLVLLVAFCFRFSSQCSVFQWNDPNITCPTPILVKSIHVWAPKHGISLPHLLYRNPSPEAEYTIRILADGTFHDKTPVHCRVAMIGETPAVNPSQYAAFENEDLHSHFDLVFTYSHKLLELDANKFRNYIAGGSWVLEEHERLIPQWSEAQITERVLTFMEQKEKAISMLLSRKSSTPGHKFRHHIHHMVKERHPGLVDFYSAGSGEKKEALEHYGFTIIIENDKEQGNHFSSHLIDALVTLTVPIYWGKPVFVTSTFDPSGFVFFEREEELDDILDVLTHQWQNIYASKIDALECNMKKALNREMTDLAAYRNVANRLYDESTGELRCGMCGGSLG